MNALLAVHTDSARTATLPRLVILMPVRDDWISASTLIRGLDEQLRTDAARLDLVLVDDASSRPCDPDAFQADYQVVRSIRVIRLRRNLGHQRAIAIGLVHVDQTMSCDALLVMDSDGEDTPEGALTLIRAFTGADGEKAVFAERSRRTESLLFRVFYLLYKGLHHLLTGIRVRVGNFSILPAAYLSTLVVTSELWNHYAAAIFRSGLPFTSVPIPRGRRIAGKSTMNFVTLTAHGMSAISVFGDIVGVRLLIACMAGSLLAVLGIVTAAMIRFFTVKAIPGWTTYATGMLTIILIQLISIAVSFTFTILSSRINLSFVPLRDYSLFIAGTRTIYSHE